MFGKHAYFCVHPRPAKSESWTAVWKVAHFKSTQRLKPTEALVPLPLEMRSTNPSGEAVAALRWKDSESWPVKAFFEKTNIERDDF